MTGGLNFQQREGDRTRRRLELNEEDGLQKGSRSVRQCRARWRLEGDGTHQLQVEEGFREQGPGKPEQLRPFQALGTLLKFRDQTSWERSQ